MNFRLDLPIFRGPLDLLLYLVRKHELDVAEVPMTAIADQFMEHLAVLTELDINAVGDFLDMASTMMEIKSRVILPRPEEETDQLEDPREELVERLLEYKKYKDAASILEERSRDWQQRYSRLADDLPPRKIDIADQPIQEVEMWDLVSAFGRLLRSSQMVQESNIVYDETPITSYMQELHRRMIENGRVCFSEMFHQGMHKSAMIGVFLAILELVRHHSVRTQQDGLHGEIWITPGEAFDQTLDLSNIDQYVNRQSENAAQRSSA